MKNKHIGGNFDDYLKEEGVWGEAEAMATKRVTAYKITKKIRLLNIMHLVLKTAPRRKVSPCILWWRDFL